MDDLNTVGNNLDPYQNVKIPKHKNSHFRRGQIQFGTVNFALRGGTVRVRIKEPCAQEEVMARRIPSLVGNI